MGWAACWARARALAAALRIQQDKQPTRRVILSERDNFPTDLYMIQGMIDLLQQGYEMRLIDDELPLDKALDDSVAVMLLSHVNYRRGPMHDMAAVTAACRRRGAGGPERRQRRLRRRLHL
ncbi:hypothetical protein G6F62_013880 [Rhizopus arrhizus]|nr:hypothetical protein G6F62_013880 [Rhizopus arrhizus]